MIRSVIVHAFRMVFAHITSASQSMLLSVLSFGTYCCCVGVRYWTQTFLIDLSWEKGFLSHGWLSLSSWKIEWAYVLISITCDTAALKSYINSGCLEKYPLQWIYGLIPSFGHSFVWLHTGLNTEKIICFNSLPPSLPSHTFLIVIMACMKKETPLGIIGINPEERHVRYGFCIHWL